jgi:hypothetical protein
VGQQGHKNGEQSRFGQDICRGERYTFDEFEFMTAIQRWKETTGNPHPSWADVLRIAKALGYRRIADNGDEQRQH